MKILVVRKSGGLGDIVCCEPVIRGLRERYPHAHITFGMPEEFVCLFDNRSEAHYKGYCETEFTVHWMRRYEEQYDIFIDLHGPATRDEQHGSPECSRTESFCNYAGIPASPPEIHVTEAEKHAAADELAKYPRPWVGFGPDGTNWTRNWPKDRWGRLIAETPGTKFYFTKDPKATFKGAIPIVGRSLREIASLIANLDIMITVDTGLLHLAGAVGTKTFSLWGPTEPKRTVKHYADAYYLEPAPYRTKVGCKKACLYSPMHCLDVNDGISKCMRALGADEVIDSINKLMGKPGQTEKPQIDTPAYVHNSVATPQEYKSKMPVARKDKRKRIVWIGKYLLPAIGGAERSSVEMLNHLSAKGYDVMAFWSHDSDGPIEEYEPKMRDGILWAKTPPGILVLKMLEADPDLVITQLSAAASIPTALPKRIPLFLMLRSASDHFCQNARAGVPCINGETVDLEGCDKACIDTPTLNAPYHLMKNVYGCADEVFANSESMKRVFKHFTGRDCLVQYPVPRRKASKRDTSKEFCVAIRPDIGRGLEFLKELAIAMPEEHFLWVDGPPSGLNNVTVKDRIEDLGKVFKKALVMLCPHTAYEAFGRVPAEAGAAGIPSITSHSGGLPESVGKGGYSEPLDVGKWVERIRKLRTSNITWRNRSKAAIKHAKSLGWDALMKAIEEHVGTLS